MLQMHHSSSSSECMQRFKVDRVRDVIRRVYWNLSKNIKARRSSNETAPIRRQRDRPALCFTETQQNESITAPSFKAVRCLNYSSRAWGMKCPSLPNMRVDAELSCLVKVKMNCDSLCFVVTKPSSLYSSRILWKSSGDFTSLSKVVISRVQVTAKAPSTWKIRIEN